MGSWVRAPAGSRNKEGAEMFLPFYYPPMYTLYILYSISLDRYYVGYTNDLKRRLSEHNRKKGKYTDKGIPWKFFYTEDFESKKMAMSREANIKSEKSKSYIIELINSR
jgi:putative endonuclease